MKKIFLVLAFAVLWSQPVLATSRSTINTTIPIQGSPLASAPIRNNFIAAYNDINNLYSLIGGGGSFLTTTTVFTGTGDCALSGNYNNIVSVCTKTAGVAFGPLATVTAVDDTLIITNGVLGVNGDVGGGLSIGVVNTKINSFATNTVYAAGVTTYSTGTYTAPAGPQPVPLALAAGQVYFANFNQTNPGAANLIMAGLPVKALKIVNGSGTVLAMTGGEIVPGPATIYYDGTEFLYSVPFTAVAAPVTTATTASVSDFINQKTYYLTAGSETITLPCANTVSQNGAIKVYSVVGTITIAKGSACSDTLNKNNTTGTSTTISQGAAPAIINTDGISNFYISGS